MYVEEVTHSNNKMFSAFHELKTPFHWRRHEMELNLENTFLSGFVNDTLPQKNLIRELYLLSYIWVL